VVDQIVDVAEESVTIRQQSHRKGLLGSAVVGKHVTDFLDLGAVLAASKENWLHSCGNARQKQSVLVAGKSGFARGLMRGVLEMSGYVVAEAEDCENTIRTANVGDTDLVVALQSGMDNSEYLKLLGSLRPSLQATIPILAIVDSTDERFISRLRTAGIHECREATDREGILEALGQMLRADTQSSVDLECAVEVA